MSKKLLIVNADDCNLTPGVTKAILDCHDHGILTSTTFMVNLPVSSETVRAVLRRKNLGVGIHLNVTLAKPVSQPDLISSLLGPEERFRKLGEQTGKLPKASQLALEYQNQINRFRKIFGRKPTHLDTHHQVHDHSFFYEVLRKIGKTNDLPIRRSRMMSSLRAERSNLETEIASSEKSLLAMTTPRTTDYFFGNLTVEGYWRKPALEIILSHLPEGSSEVMCHPGIHDRDLEAISSFTSGRVEEYRLFRSPALRRLASAHGITLGHFGHVL